LLNNPVKTVNEAGLVTTRERPLVRVIKVEPSDFGKMDDKIIDWFKGDKTGIYTLWLPMKPWDLDPDGADLVPGVAAGTTCTPCTTCT
jgi:hypothetical protein